MVPKYFIVVACLFFTVVSLGGCDLLKSQTATIEKYPTKPITTIVPFAAGGAVDMIARTMNKTAAKHIDQSLVISNMPGAASTIGWNELVGAKPDGYTIGFISSSMILQPLYGQTRYHYPTAIDPLVHVTSFPIVLAVRSDKQWQSVEELVKYAKEHPGKIKYGHSGLGQATHVVAEMFSHAAGIDIDQVPFRGDAESIVALLGGHVHLAFVAYPSIKEQVKAGKVNVLALSSEQRLKNTEQENIPTFKENGLDVVFSLWHGIGAPQNMPRDVKAKLTKGLTAIVNDADFIKDMEILGMTVEYLGPEEFKAKVIEGSTKLKKVVQETGIAERIAAQKN